MEVMIGASVNLTCVARGNPPPEIRWRMGDMQLTPRDRVPTVTNVLILQDLNETATYTCEAENELGSDLWHSEVCVKGI